MDYNEFVEYVQNNILDFMPERYLNAEVKVIPVTKNNNQVLKGLTIHLPEDNITPTLYLEKPYSDYKNGNSMKTVMTYIAENYLDAEREKSNAVSFDTNDLLDYEMMKPRIIPRVINPMTNIEKLSKVPFVMFNDLAVTFYCEVTRNSESYGAFCITNELLREYGVTADELYNVALENLKTKSSPIVRSMFEIMAEDFGMPVPPEPSMDDIMYVISNEDKNNGSCQILNSDVMSKAAQKLGGDFYIIPSSIHELIAVPKGKMPISEMESMIRDVNENQVAPEERLSNTLYAFDAIKKEVILATELELRREKSVYYEADIDIDIDDDGPDL